MKLLLGPIRYDYSFPLRINAASRQVQRVDYAEHVAQMVREFLLTAPGERVCLPDFGGGLRRILFSPKTSALASTTELLIREGLDKYLGQQIQVNKVSVSEPPDLDDGAFQVLVEYTLIETQSSASVILRIR
jgi:phage baseplate assembly protein W